MSMFSSVSSILIDGHYSSDEIPMVLEFFKNGGAKISYDPKNKKRIIIEPSLFMLATSNMYSIVDDEIVDDYHVSFMGFPRYTGLYAHNGCVLYMYEELQAFIKSSRDKLRADRQRESCSISTPRCNIL